MVLFLCWAVTVIIHRPGHDHIKASSSWVMEKSKEVSRVMPKKTLSRGPSEDMPDTAIIQVMSNNISLIMYIVYPSSSVHPHQWHHLETVQREWKAVEMLASGPTLFGWRYTETTPGLVWTGNLLYIHRHTTVVSAVFLPSHCLGLPVVLRLDFAFVTGCSRMSQRTPTSLRIQIWTIHKGTNKRTPPGHCIFLYLATHHGLLPLLTLLRLTLSRQPFRLLTWMRQEECG